MSNNNERRQTSIWKPIILLTLLLVTPMVAIKIAKRVKNDDVERVVTTMTKEEVDSVVENYIRTHPEELLDAVTSTYYEKFIGQDKSNRINNAIAVYSKVLFDDKLPQLGAESNNMKILMLFSDFDLAGPMLEKISEYPDSLKAHFYFRQIVTQTKFSAIIARYGYAVYKVDPSKYISYYLSVFRIEKSDLNLQKIEDVIDHLNLNLDKVREIADSEETEKIVMESIDVAKRMKVDELPAWIFENGMIVFGVGGFEAVKKAAL
jgi:hypothetical protein